MSIPLPPSEPSLLTEIGRWYTAGHGRWLVSVLTSLSSSRPWEWQNGPGLQRVIDRTAINGSFGWFGTQQQWPSEPPQQQRPWQPSQQPGFAFARGFVPLQRGSPIAWVEQIEKGFMWKIQPGMSWVRLRSQGADEGGGEHSILSLIHYCEEEKGPQAWVKACF